MPNVKVSVYKIRDFSGIWPAIRVVDTGKYFLIQHSFNGTIWINGTSSSKMFNINNSWEITPIMWYIIKDLKPEIIELDIPEYQLGESVKIIEDKPTIVKVTS